VTGKADAKAAFARVHQALGGIAAERQRMGAELPDEFKQVILNIRRRLFEVGMPPQEIDRIPGLEVDWRLSNEEWKTIAQEKIRKLETRVGELETLVRDMKITVGLVRNQSWRR
jgi:hypothetical protein